MEYFHLALAFIAAHPAGSYLVASAVVNLVLDRVPPTAMVAWCERHRGGRLLVRTIRACGVDPAGLIRGGQVALAAEAARRAALSLPGGSVPPPAGGE